MTTPPQPNWPFPATPTPAPTPKKATQMAEFEAYGERHHAEGIPRSANPFLIAAFNNGARKPEKLPSVRAWWAGWDRAGRAS